jgi:hypothetical protein
MIFDLTIAMHGAEYFCRRHLPEYLHNDMVAALVRRAELRDIRLAKRLMEAGVAPSSAPKFLFGGLYASDHMTMPIGRAPKTEKARRRWGN